MGDRARVTGAVLLGAAMGGVVGFLFLTDRGRAFRQEWEPRLDEMLTEARRVRGAVDKLRVVVEEGRRSLNQVVGGEDRTPDWVTTYRATAGY